MKLIVNGESAEVDAITLEELLSEYEIDGNGNEKGVAVAVNDDVIPKNHWEDHTLKDNDRIEIIRATQGG